MLARLTRWLDRLIVAMDTGSLWLARLGGLLILLTVGMVTLEVITRSVWGRSLGASTELSGYVLAISASWSFAHALFRKAHIRIDLLYLYLTRTPRAVLDLVALASLGLFCVFVVGAVIGVASHSYAQGSLANTPLLTPLWIPQWLWAGGMLWFSISVAVLLLRVILALVSLQPGQVQRLAGSPTLDDQVEAQTMEDKA